jgi:hypothetical protein
MKKIILNPNVSKSFISKLKVDDIYKEIISLDDNSDYKLNKDLHIPRDTIEYCLGKKNDLINLALAKVVRDSDSLKLIYFASNDEAKHLVLSNPSIKPLLSFEEEDRTFFDEITFKSFISNTSEEHLMSYYMNECFILTDFNSLFHREEPYKSISDERWINILKIVSWNKNIKSNVDGVFGSIKYDKFGNAEDGSLWYDRTQKEDAPWALLKHLEPSNSTHLHILENLYKRVAYKVINFSIEEIKSIFNKWKYNSDFDTKDKKFKEILNRLRQLLSYRICEDNERKEGLWNYFRTNEDKHLRYGYYRVYNPSLESIKQHYDKDKDLFIEAAIDNNYFYLRRNEKENEIADLFIEYKDKTKQEWLRGHYNYKKTTLRKEAPILFNTEDSYDRKLDEGELIKEIDKNSKLVETVLFSKIKDSTEQSEQENLKVKYWVAKQIRFNAELQDKILERIRNLRNLELQLKEQTTLIKNLKGLVIVALIAVVLLTIFNK